MTVIADLLLPFCDAASVSQRDASDTLRKRVLVSLAFVDTRALHDALFPKQHLDWQGVQDYLGDLSYTADDWMHLLRLLDFVNETPPRPGVAEMLSNAMAGVCTQQQTKKAGGARQPLTPIDALRMCFARARLSVDWDTLCKALIMCNLADMDHLGCLTCLLAKQPEKQQRATAEQVAEIVRFLPSCRHTPAEYMDAFAGILHANACQVRTHLIVQSFARREKLLEARRQQTILTGQAFKRPSLTAMLAAKAARQGSGPCTDDSFGAFVQNAKIAANASTRVKQVAYYLACLPPHEDRSAQIAYTVGGDHVVHASVMALNIVRPDVRALCDTIGASHHTGAPFDALRRFRESCVGSSCLIVASTGRRTVHWTTIFKLYLAAHCRPELWKDLWSDIIRSASTDSDSLGLGLHSSAPEAESSVQAFARANPMALRECVQLMLS